MGQRNQETNEANCSEEVSGTYELSKVAAGISVQVAVGRKLCNIDVRQICV
jgi:hypothetical protein